MEITKSQIDKSSEFLTISEVAALLRVSRKTVYKQVLGGAMQHTRIGRQYRISFEDYDNFRSRPLKISR